MISIPDAIEVFVRSFSLAKSKTYPYVPTKVGDLWIMRDDPPRKKERKIEIIAHGPNPADIVKEVEESQVGWHFLCHIHAPDEDFQGIRKQFKELGYRSMSTEWLFAHALANIPIHDSTPPVRPVPDVETLDQINRVTSRPKILRPNTRFFSVWDETKEVGWVTSIPFKDSAWVHDLYVQSEFRGKGYGRALMSKLLMSDRENGVKQSVLLASSAGARLYPYIGYQQIGVLQMFCPITRPSV